MDLLWLWIAAAFLAGFGLALVFLFIWYEFVRVRTTADEVYFVPTGDGAEIVLYRYRSEVSIDERTAPIILCHGLMANHYSFDIGKRPGSLARYLRGRGYDTWVLELRGRDRKTPRLTSPSSYNWSFAHYVRYDAPAALAFVRERTQSRRLIWMGHSMGGMIGYALASQSMAEHLLCLVTLASPVEFQHMKLLKSVAKWFIRFYKLPVVPAEAFIKIMSPFLSLYSLNRMSVIANASNFTYMERLIVLGNILGNISTQVMREFALSVDQGNFHTADGSVDFRRDFSKINLPILFVSGGSDGLVPPRAVKSGYERCQSSHKEYLCVDPKYGFASSLGHGDIILSERAESELYPLIVSFMEKVISGTSNE